VATTTMAAAAVLFLLRHIVWSLPHAPRSIRTTIRRQQQQQLPLPPPPFSIVRCEQQPLKRTESVSRIGSEDRLVQEGWSGHCLSLPTAHAPVAAFPAMERME
jgi:hypothetical protein